MLILAHLTDSLLTITPTLGVMSPVLINLMIGAFLLISIAMILLVLIQRPQGGGLSGAFGSGGGSGAGQTAFGTKTGDVLTYATIGIFVCFLLFAIVLNFATRPPQHTSNQTVLTTPQQSEEDAAAEIEQQQNQSDQDSGDETIDLSGNPDQLDPDAGSQTPGSSIPPAIPPTNTPPSDTPDDTPADAPSEPPAGGE